MVQHDTDTQPLWERWDTHTAVPGCSTNRALWHWQDTHKQTLQIRQWEDIQSQLDTQRYQDTLLAVQEQQVIKRALTLPLILLPQNTFLSLHTHGETSVDLKKGNDMQQHLIWTQCLSLQNASTPTILHCTVQTYTKEMWRQPFFKSHYKYGYISNLLIITIRVMVYNLIWVMFFFYSVY